MTSKKKSHHTRSAFSFSELNSFGNLFSFASLYARRRISARARQNNFWLNSRICSTSCFSNFGGRIVFHPSACVTSSSSVLSRSLTYRFSIVWGTLWDFTAFFGPYFFFPYSMYGCNHIFWPPLSRSLATYGWLLFSTTMHYRCAWHSNDSRRYEYVQSLENVIITSTFHTFPPKILEFIIHLWGATFNAHIAHPLLKCHNWK